MSTSKKSIGWSAVNLGVILLMMACTVVGNIFNGDDASVRIEDGTIEVKYQNGDWRPADADSAFDLIAQLESIDPWMVAGKALEIDESTEIADGLQVGDLVRVRGIILEDNVWLAKSIELAEEQVDPIIILIGRVDSVDPWMVNGISLNVTDETEIEGTIEPGMLVRVEIILLEDGTWQVLRISPLENVPEFPGCTAIIATIVSIDGNQIVLLGWPAVTLSDDAMIEGDATLEPNQTVLVVVCPGEDDQIVIVQIIIIQIDVDDGEAVENGTKVLVCHKPTKKGGHTLSISSSAIPAHLGHGDTLGPCP